MKVKNGQYLILSGDGRVMMYLNNKHEDALADMRTFYEQSKSLHYNLSKQIGENTKTAKIVGATQHSTTKTQTQETKSGFTTYQIKPTTTERI